MTKKTEEIYCCDEYGRPFVFRTIDGKPRPIAVMSALAKAFIQLMGVSNYDATEKYILLALKEKSKKVKSEKYFKERGLVLEEMLEDILRRAIELIGEDLESALKKGESTKELEDAKRAVERILESRKILQRLIDNIRKDVRQIPEKLTIGALLSSVVKVINTISYEDIKMHRKIVSEVQSIVRSLKIGDLPYSEYALVCVYESIKRIRIVEAIAKRHLEEYPDKKIILLGSAAKLEATPISDVELYILHDADEETLEKQKLFFMERIAERLGVTPDIQHIQPEKLAESLKEKEKRPEEREKKITWLLTPVKDGILIDKEGAHFGEKVNDEKSLEVIEKFIISLAEAMETLEKEHRYHVPREILRKLRESDELEKSDRYRIIFGLIWGKVREWAVARLRRTLKETLKEKNTAKTHHRILSFFASIKRLGMKIETMRSWKNRPYWRILYSEKNPEGQRYIAKVLKWRVKGRIPRYDREFLQSIIDKLREPRDPVVVLEKVLYG